MKNNKKQSAAPAQKPAEKVRTPKATPAVTYTYNDNLFKKIFYGSLVAMFALLAIAGYDSGICYDDVTMNVYGKTNIAYYTSGFKDTSFMAPEFSDMDGAGQFIPSFSYGSVVEYIGLGMNAVMGNLDGYEYNTTHLLYQFIAIIGFMFTGLLARRLTRKYFTAVIAIWLIYLTPTIFGYSIFNMKDIPFLTGYIATLYYMVLFLEGLPKPSWKTTIGLLLAMFFMLSVRIGGLLMYMYIFLFMAIWFLRNKEFKDGLLKNIKNWLPKMAIALGGSLVLMVLAWPYVLHDPMKNFMGAIQIVTKFPQRLPLVFDGEYMDSLNLPTNYLPKSMFITIPALMLAAIIASPFFIIPKYKQYKGRMLSLILFSSLFPIVYAIYTHASMYHTWRHFLFVYPGFIVWAAVGLDILFDKFKKPSHKWILAGVLVLCALNPILWLLRTSPYQYVYFNEFTGGFANVFHNYEKDSWTISNKEAIDWLVEHEHLKDSKDTVVIGTNAQAIAHYYVKRRYKGCKIKVVNVSVRSRNLGQWDYAILCNYFLTPEWEEAFFPPKQTIHTVDIDGMPVTAIVKDRQRYDLKALDAMMANNFPVADSLFNLYLKAVDYNPQTPADFGGLAGYIAYTKMAVQKLPEAAAFAQNAIKSNEGDYQGYLVLGIVNFAQNNFPAAKQYLNISLQINPNNPLAKEYLSRMP